MYGTETISTLCMHLTDSNVHPGVLRQKGDCAVGRHLHVLVDAVKQVAVIVIGRIAPVMLSINVPHLCQVNLDK